MQRLTQAGTRRAPLLVAALLTVACGDGTKPSTSPDAGTPDDQGDGQADHGDGTPADGCVGDCGSDAGTPCDQARAREAAFVADHSACAVDADCVAIGSCDNAEFLAVSAASATEAEALLEARPDACRAQDGPVPYAVCREAHCAFVYASRACGQPPDPSCPAGQEYVSVDCDGQGDVGGCAVRCDFDLPTLCAPGFTCQAAAVAPCSDAVEGGGACGDCVADAHVCRPAPDCTLAIDLALDLHDVATLGRDQAAELTATLTNLTDAPLTFQYDAPCHGPAITGLGDYDLWEGCLAGACPDDSASTTLTLAAREQRTLARSLITTSPSTCNAAGLAPGTYTLGLTLAELSGAVVCGPSPVELRVLSSATGP